MARIVASSQGDSTIQIGNRTDCHDHQRHDQQPRDREVLKARMAGAKAALENVAVGDNPYNGSLEWHWIEVWMETRMEMRQNIRLSGIHSENRLTESILNNTYD